jgi:hypothetical protein
VPETESKFSALANGSGWLAGQGPLGLRRTALAAAAALFGLLIGVGATARAVIGPAEPPAEKSAAAAPKTAPATAPKVEAPQAAPVVEKKATPVAKKEPAPKVAKKAGPKPVVVAAASAGAAQKGPGRLELAVNPWGEIFVDGQSRGVSPPMRTLEISPGSHTIEIRNSTFPSHVQKVEIKSGDAVRIRHRFK